MKRVDPRPAARGPEAIEDLWLYLHLMLEAIWDYRFLYRDLDDLVSRNRRLRHAHTIAQLHTPARETRPMLGDQRGDALQIYIDDCEDVGDRG